MFKSKELKITTSKNKYKVNNEVPIHPRSISKNMEVKGNVEMGSGCVWYFVNNINPNNVRGARMVTKEIKIGNCTFKDQITVKEVLLKIKNFEIGGSELTEIFSDKDCYKQYVDDALKLCQSCGIYPIVDTTPGEEQYCINMFELLCEDTPLHKMLFRQFAEDIDYGEKEYFSNQIDDGSTTVLKFEDEYNILRIPYKNVENLKFDIEKVAMKIVALSEPNLELLPLVNFKMENCDCTCDYFNKKAYGKEDIKSQKMSRKYPFIIHLSFMNINDAFPTHTHGLNKKGWPEFMIDPLCYGSEGNADMINSAYDYFKKPRRRKILNRILAGKIIEVPVNKVMKHLDWKTLTYSVCFRLVPNTFEAVKMAYGTEDGNVDPDLVVVQIYVKGDDFALTDDYYKNGITW